MMDAQIGSRLKAAREKAGMSQKDVVAKVDSIAKEQNLSNYERGVNQIAAETLRELSKLYQVSADWILFGEDSIKPSHKKRSDYIKDLFAAVEKLGLPFEEQIVHQEFGVAYPTGEYIIWLKAPLIQGFDDLIKSLQKIFSIRDSIEQDDFDMLVQKKINDCAIRSNDFEDISADDLEEASPENDSFDMPPF